MDDFARLKKLYSDILWTHKIQEKQADIYSERARKWKIASIVCVAVTGSGLLTGVLSDLYAIQVASVFIAAASLFVTVYREAMDYESKSFDSARAATAFLSLRNKAEKVLSKTSGCVDCEIDVDLQELSELYDTLCQVSPRTSDEAVARADKAKANGEFSEMVIDG